jgi:hypothetical protein
VLPNVLDLHHHVDERARHAHALLLEHPRLSRIVFHNEDRAAAITLHG